MTNEVPTTSIVARAVSISQRRGPPGCTSKCARPREPQHDRRRCCCCEAECPARPCAHGSRTPPTTRLLDLLPRRRDPRLVDRGLEEVLDRFGRHDSPPR